MWSSLARSVRIGQASFTESNRIGWAGLFPNGAERSGLGNGILAQNARLAESAERQNGQNAERRRKGILADFSQKIRFAPIWGNWRLTGSSGLHSCMNGMLTIWDMNMQWQYAPNYASCAVTVRM